MKLEETPAFRKEAEAREADEKSRPKQMPAHYLMGASIIGIVSVLALHETARKPLLGPGPCVATHAEAVAKERA